MSGILSGVDQRTQLAGHNRLELLLFRLNGKQIYGINVFKVQEVIQKPALTNIPGSHRVVKGLAYLRGKNIPVMDLSMAIGLPPLENSDSQFVIVTEFNRAIQGFLVGSVDRIVNLYWKDIKPPPHGADKCTYLTAITEIDKQLVEVIDVEKVLSEVVGGPETVSQDKIDTKLEKKGHVLVVDDSLVARNQVKRVLDDLGLESTLAVDGRDGLEKLRSWVEQGINVPEFLTMLISDVEMPRMDGYTLTTEIRKMPELKDLYVMLHTSLSGVFNQSMVEKVGADIFMAKYKPDELAEAIQVRMREIQSV